MEPGGCGAAQQNGPRHLGGQWDGDAYSGQSGIRHFQRIGSRFFFTSVNFFHASFDAHPCYHRLLFRL
jgi:hypothetical protein